MERETKTITTPIGKNEVVLKAWISGREQEAIGKPLMDCMSMSVKNESPEIEAKGAVGALEEVKRLKIKTIVVSVDGNTDTDELLLDTILDMRSVDFNYVITEIEKIAEAKDFTTPESSPEKDTGSGS